MTFPVYRAFIMLGTIFITQLLVTSSMVSFLSSQFVISELFCGDDMYFSHAYTYERTYIEHPIPKGFDECLIRIRDNKNNILTKIVTVP